MDEKNLQIALFKFKLIAAVLTDESINQKKYFKHLSKKEYDVPFLGKRKFSPSTFKKWLINYRKYGFDGLKPTYRKDKGTSRAISDELKEKISSLVNTYRFRTVQNLYNYLLESNTITTDRFSYATLNSFVKANKLFTPEIQKKERKAFEVEHINQLWIADFMYGPYVLDGRRKIRSYLCAIIDDCSRLIVSARFYSTQSTLAFETTLKDAILSYGIPGKVYTDNGKVFLDGHLALISARIGFILIHSKVYDSASHGKIERFFSDCQRLFYP